MIVRARLFRVLTFAALATAALTFTAAAPAKTGGATDGPLTFSGGELPPGALGVFYRACFSASGGTPPYTYYTPGPVPSNVTIGQGNNSNCLVGAPTSYGAFPNIPIYVKDANGATAEAHFSLTIYKIKFILDGQSAGVVGDPFLTQLKTYTDPPSQFNWSIAVASGTLPPGLSLAANGTLSGTPTQAGTYTFTTKSTSEIGPGTNEWSITITAPPPIDVAPASLEQTVAYTAYNAKLSATGGKEPYTWAVTAGALPPGIVLASDGTVSGAATKAGTFDFTVTATDARGRTATHAYTIVVTWPALQFSPTALKAATIGKLYRQTLVVSGGKEPYTFLKTGGRLPAGVRLLRTGVLTGKPRGKAGSFTFTVAVLDANGAPGSATYTLKVKPAPKKPAKKKKK